LFPIARLSRDGQAEAMNTSSTTTSSATTPVTPAAGLASRSRTLSRPVHGRMLAGVASGIARYLNIEVVLVRIALVVAVFVGGIGIPLYLACWLLMPEETAEQSIAGEFVSSVNTWRN
jgi:phage shock protein PspC (stress-responsive transcriptional regulator)